MSTRNSQAGFSLLELLAATALGLVVIGTAMTTFKDALGMTNVATNLADASQNLRGGTNRLVRDLIEAGRGIPTGGIPIPNGAGVGPINRPSPPGLAYTFDNIASTTLTAIVTGGSKGPVIDGRATDMVTILTIDPILDTALNGTLQVQLFNTVGAVEARRRRQLAERDAERTDLGGRAIRRRTAGDREGDLLMFMDPAATRRFRP
jgi:prepilin-type N-terminal cleavage/methylation domain-containing protein